MYNRTQLIRENIKKIFDKRTKAASFAIGDKILKWDARREDKGKHNKLDNLWMGPYIINDFRGDHAFFLTDIDGIELPGSPVNGRMLKNYFS